MYDLERSWFGIHVYRRPTPPPSFKSMVRSQRRHLNPSVFKCASKLLLEVYPEVCQPVAPPPCVGGASVKAFPDLMTENAEDERSGLFILRNCAEMSMESFRNKSFPPRSSDCPVLWQKKTAAPSGPSGRGFIAAGTQRKHKNWLSLFYLLIFFHPRCNASK